MTAELESLIAALRDEDLATAIRAAKSIAFVGDSSVVPRLFAELEFARQRIEEKKKVGMDARELRRPFAIEQAIVSLLPLDDCQRELEEGRLSSEWLLQHRRETKSLEEFWGYLRG